MSKVDIKYHNLLQKILDEGYDYLDESRQVNCKQISSYEFRHNLRTEGFPAISTKKLYSKGVVGELIWFLRGETNIQYLINNNINIWNKDAYNYYLKECNILNIKSLKFNQFIHDIRTKNINELNLRNTDYCLGNLGPVYGAQWRNYLLGNDQIKDLIQNLKDKPMSRRHLVTAWNPAELDQMALPPCHWAFEIIPRPLTLKERRKIWNPKNSPTGGIVDLESHLDYCKIPKYVFDLKWHQRSVDTFLGLPFNIASYGLLAEIIGKLTNMIPNELIGDLSNVHIYEPHIDAVKTQLSRDVNKYENSNLSLKDEFYYITDENLVGKIDLDQIFSEMNIDWFKLENYESYPAIQAEMIEPKI